MKRVDFTNQLRGIGKRIREGRSERGLSQGDLAFLSGVSQPHISRLERGVSGFEGLGVHTAMRVAAALQMELEVLVGLRKRRRAA
jgi:transcriptional regulator with XRE-family HTH domain